MKITRTIKTTTCRIVETVKDENGEFKAVTRGETEYVGEPSVKGLAKRCTELYPEANNICLIPTETHTRRYEVDIQTFLDVATAIKEAEDNEQEELSNE